MIAAQGVYVRSKKNALIEVHTQVRLPRTFRRFCGLFAQLLQKLSVRSTNSKERMLKVRSSGFVPHLATSCPTSQFRHNVVLQPDHVSTHRLARVHEARLRMLTDRRGCRL